MKGRGRREKWQCYQRLLLRKKAEILVTPFLQFIRKRNGATRMWNGSETQINRDEGGEERTGGKAGHSLPAHHTPR